MKTTKQIVNEYTELEVLKTRCDELQSLLAALVKVCAMWPGPKNPEHFPEMVAARKCLAETKAVTFEKALVKAVLEWARTPGDHGGNPYCKDFVKLAMEMSAQEAKQLNTFLTT